jgi:hypothetical protein
VTLFLRYPSSNTQLFIDNESFLSLSALSLSPLAVTLHQRKNSSISDALAVEVEEEKETFYFAQKSTESEADDFLWNQTRRVLCKEKHLRGSSLDIFLWIISAKREYFNELGSKFI